MDFSQDLIKGSVVPAVLALLSERPMYGYEMIKLVNARTGGRLEWREGTLYPTLHRLESEGLVRSEWREAPTPAKTGDNARGEDPGGARQRKYYAITRAGRTELRRRAGEWREFSTAVSLLLGGSGGAP